MKLTDTILTAESTYKQILEEFFLSVYSEKSLTSHGIDHHRRVWNYAKELLGFLEPEYTGNITRLTDELIVSCYLHDIGMSVDPGIEHGKHSRDFCARFLDKYKIQEADFINALNAIENHDDKNYTAGNTKTDLLTILSVADDLDAFGCIGIYRYAEIYLVRHVDVEKIGKMIRENAGKRYDNFLKTFGSSDEMVVKHWERYYLLDIFFSKYNDQLTSYQFGSQSPIGFCGVIEIIKSILDNNLLLPDFCANPEKHTHDPLITWFFTELNKELSSS
jgi:HD superfamily phosphodiesterase